MLGHDPLPHEGVFGPRVRGSFSLIRIYLFLILKNLSEKIFNTGPNIVWGGLVRLEYMPYKYTKLYEYVLYTVPNWIYYYV